MTQSRTRFKERSPEDSDTLYKNNVRCTCVILFSRPSHVLSSSSSSTSSLVFPSLTLFWYSDNSVAGDKSATRSKQRRQETGDNTIDWKRRAGNRIGPRSSFASSCFRDRKILVCVRDWEHDIFCTETIIIIQSMPLQASKWDIRDWKKMKRKMKNQLSSEGTSKKKQKISWEEDSVVSSHGFHYVLTVMSYCSNRRLYTLYSLQGRKR